MSAYYNEYDPFAAAWLRELIADNLIAPGEVDERDIQDVKPDDLRPFRQCHFFAGIGVWSAALRGAGWADDRPVWTGSPPCQSLSAAGSRGGFLDERHLWPTLYHLAEECRPPVLFGEQVASALGLAWLDLVSSDMEAAGYAGGALDLCSAGFGAPNIRQRLYFVWVADAGSRGLRRRQEYRADIEAPEGMSGTARQQWLRTDDSADGAACGLADAGREGLSQQRGDRRVSSGEVVAHTREGAERDGSSTCGLAHPHGGHPGAEGLQRGGEQRQQPEDGGAGGLADTDGSGRDEGQQDDLQSRRQLHDERRGDVGVPGPLNGFWRDADWIGCTDGKWRPVRPGSFPLATGIANRVGTLRGAGNAINKEVAQGFIEAVMARAHGKNEGLTHRTLCPILLPSTTGQWPTERER